MSVVRRVLSVLPGPVRALAPKHREALRFLLVGGTSFLVTSALNYTLKFTVLKAKPVTALVLATIVATIVSYVLNREWSFSARGGRERHHEAALFFLISGIGVGLNSLPYVISRYVLDLQVPRVSLLEQEVADFISGMIIGTLIAMVFRFWAFRRWVFPVANERKPKAAESQDGPDFSQAA